MRAAKFAEIGKIEVGTAPDPELLPGTAIVKVLCCGVCGTDKHIFLGEFPAEFPVIPGHEISGVVQEVHDTVTSVKPGDVVTIDPNIVCHRCEYCRQGKRHLCQNLKNHGIEVNGGFAEFVRVAERELVKVPVEDEANFPALALSEPVGCCLHGLQLADVKPGDKVIIQGAGPIGLVMTQVVKLKGPARLTVIEPVEMKRQLALELGADEVFDPAELGDLKSSSYCHSADVAFDCAGIETTVRALVDLVRDGGTAMYFGVCAPQDTVSLHPFEIYRRELRIQGAFTKAWTLVDAVDLIVSGRVRLDPLITDTYQVEQFPDALSRVGSPETIKNMIVFDQ